MSVPRCWCRVAGCRCRVVCRLVGVASSVVASTVAIRRNFRAFRRAGGAKDGSRWQARNERRHRLARELIHRPGRGGRGNAKAVHKSQPSLPPLRSAIPVGECSAALVNALPPLPGRLLDLDNPGGGARSSLATGYRLPRLRRSAPFPENRVIPWLRYRPKRIDRQSAIRHQSSADVARVVAWSSSDLARSAAKRHPTTREAQPTDNRQRAAARPRIYLACCS
jgi:hypothetical protein